MVVRNDIVGADAEDKTINRNSLVDVAVTEVIVGLAARIYREHILVNDNIDVRGNVVVF